ncbi:hypothetical protein [Mesonia sp.]|uniref:hypothetical protein n=1 Tax=Mesonia sp. TaxID=1960830 RepID=UPI00175B232F|nr:hypothetical protein [Mesonia sp.]HIB38256.1 hypothetical protein [Mesonia sp.]HIO25989.1 hypothetical protein [Flavobacteriaceae bacterium]
MKKQKDTYNSEITKQEKEMLDQENIHQDGGDDENLANRKKDVDFTGNDLDVPGSEKAKKGNGPNGLKDEENDLYSQGGNNNDLEEDKSSKG